MLEFHSLTKHFGETVAVHDLSFTVEAGKITGFLGPNGAGKTTTLRALLGLIEPTAGIATIAGKPYRDLHRPLDWVGAVLDNAKYHPGRSGRDHLRVQARMAGIVESRADELLALVDLSSAAHRRAGGYSLGMRQRLGLAAALLGNPRALVLDEPANGLDPQGIRWLRDFLRARAAEGRAVLVSSHVLAEVAQTVDDVIVIDHGRLIAQGSVDELTGRARGGVRVRTHDNAKLVKALDGAGLEWKRDGEDGYVILDAGPEDVGRLIAEKKIVIHELVALAPTLEQVFLELTDSEGRPG